MLVNTNGMRAYIPEKKKVVSSNVFVNGKFGVLLPSSPSSNVEHPASNETYAIQDNDVERADS